MTDSNLRPKKKRHKSWLALRLELLVYKGIQLVLRLMPLRLVRLVGRILGALSSRIFSRRTRLAVGNVRTTFPERKPEAHQEIVAECWRHFCAELLIYIRSLNLPAATIASGIEVVGRDLFDSVRALDKGVIVYSAHFGSWESAITVLPTLGLPFTVVARALDNELIDRDVVRGRERAVRIVNRRRAARDLIGALRKGEGVVVLPDQAVLPREGAVVPFLGRPAWTMTAPARLALKFGAPMIGCFAVPDGTRIRVEFRSPIVIDNLEEGERNEAGVTRLMNDAISGVIREHPEYWLWLHDRWKRVGTTA